MGLSFVVVTSVTRDDLPGDGVVHSADTIAAIRRISPETLVEGPRPPFQAVL